MRQLHSLLNFYFIIAYGAAEIQADSQCLVEQGSGPVNCCAAVSCCSLVWHRCERSLPEFAISAQALPGASRTYQHETQHERTDTDKITLTLTLTKILSGMK